MMSNHRDVGIRGLNYFPVGRFHRIIADNSSCSWVWVVGAVSEVGASHVLRGWVQPGPAARNQAPDSVSKYLQPNHGPGVRLSEGQQEVEHPGFRCGVDDDVALAQSCQGPVD